MTMRIYKLSREQISEWIPQRDPWAHKGDFGKILLLCGSKGYTGAAALAAMGALRSGAGLVYLGVPECIYAIEAVKLTEPIVFPLPDDGSCFSAQAINGVIQRIGKMDAVLIGCGCGKSEGVHSLLELFITQYPGALVIDADGINCLKRHKDILRERTAPTILTPHDGEFSRLGGVLTEDRISSAAGMARDLGVIVLLKGHETVITDGNTAYVNTTGNPGMAVGGSGDVLAGIITSLLGQGLAPMEAAAAAAWLHGAAGDICAQELSQAGMLPTDMLTVLARLMK